MYCTGILINLSIVSFMYRHTKVFVFVVRRRVCKSNSSCSLFVYLSIFIIKDEIDVALNTIRLRCGRGRLVGGPAGAPRLRLCYYYLC